MNNWIEQYQQTWQEQETGPLSKRVDALRQRISSDKRKDILSTSLMSLGLIAGIGAMYWVSTVLPESDWKTWVLLLSMATLMIVTIIVRVRSNMLRPRETDSGIYYLEQMLKSYTYRLRILTQWFWVYMALLPTILILFMYQVYGSDDLLMATWMSLGIIAYVAIVLFLTRKKYQKNVADTRSIINELEGMLADWK